MYIAGNVLLDPIQFIPNLEGKTIRLPCILKGFFLSGERTTFVLSSRLAITGRSLLQKSIKLCAVCFISILTPHSTRHVCSNQFLSLGLASQSALFLREDNFFSNDSFVGDFAMLRGNVRTSSLLSVNAFSDFPSHLSQHCSRWKSQIYVVVSVKPN